MSAKGRVKSYRSQFEKYVPKTVLYAVVGNRVMKRSKKPGPVKLRRKALTMIAGNGNTVRRASYVRPTNAKLEGAALYMKLRKHQNPPPADPKAWVEIAAGLKRTRIVNGVVVQRY